MTVSNPTLPPADAARQGWMGLLARARPSRLADLLPDLPNHELLRGPDIGAVMVEGRIGAVGVPFNLGEMTVTRCTLRLDSGEVGHACVQGRDKGHAIKAALVDALMQTNRSCTLRSGVLEILAQEEAQARMLRARKAAATKVEFFTLVRGEDA